MAGVNNTAMGFYTELDQANNFTVPVNPYRKLNIATASNINQNSQISALAKSADDGSVFAGGSDNTHSYKEFFFVANLFPDCAVNGTLLENSQKRFKTKGKRYIGGLLHINIGTFYPLFRLIAVGYRGDELIAFRLLMNGTADQCYPGFTFGTDLIAEDGVVSGTVTPDPEGRGESELPVVLFLKYENGTTFNSTNLISGNWSFTLPVEPEGNLQVSIEVCDEETDTRAVPVEAYSTTDFDEFGGTDAETANTTTAFTDERGLTRCSDETQWHVEAFVAIGVGAAVALIVGVVGGATLMKFYMSCTATAVKVVQPAIMGEAGGGSAGDDQITNPIYAVPAECKEKEVMGLVDAEADSEYPAAYGSIQHK